MPSTSTDTVYYDNTGGPSPDEQVNPNSIRKECFLPWPAGTLSPIPFEAGDPREALQKRLSSTNREGWVMALAEEVKDVCKRQAICRSTAVFDSDEDGAMPPRIFYCILDAGHTHRHTNGYHYWEAKPIPDEPLEVRLLRWVNEQIADLKSDRPKVPSPNGAALRAFKEMRKQIVG